MDSRGPPLDWESDKKRAAHRTLAIWAEPMLAMPDENCREAEIVAVAD